MERNSEDRARILVVEDDGVIAAYVQHVLTETGYVVAGVARSGEEALQRMARDLPDLVLMDIHLAGEMDGIETAAQIRMRYDIPVIYLTAYAEDTLLQKAKTAEPFGYLVKPVRDIELRAAIEMALYRHALEADVRARENWLNTTLGSIGDAVFATDKDGRITFMNPRAEELVGRGQEEALGQPLFEIFSVFCKDTGQSMEDLIFQAIDRRDTIHLVDCRLVAGTVADVPIEGSIASIQSREAQAVGVVLVCRDITERVDAEEALREQTARLETLRQVGLELTAQLNLERVLGSIVQRAVDLLGATTGGLYLYRARKDILEWAMAIDSHPVPIGVALQPGEGLAGKVWASGEMMIVNDYQNWEGRANVYDGYEFASTIGVPICLGDEFLGVLNLNADASRPFDQADANLLSLFATQAAIAIRNARLYEEAQRRSREQKLVVRIAYSLNTLGLRDAFPVVVEELKGLTGCDRVSVALLDEAEERFVMSILGGPSSILGEGVALPLPTTAAFEDLTAGRLHLTPDLATEKDFPGENLLWQAGYRSRVNFPLSVGGYVIGSLNLASFERDFFSEEHIPVVEQVAEVLASAVENTRLFEEEQRRRQEADTLRQTALVLTSALNEGEVISRILTQLRKVVPYDSCSLQLWRHDSVLGDEEGRLEIVGGQGFANPTDVVGLSFPVGGHNPNTLVIRSRGPVIFADAPQVYPDFTKDPHVQTTIRSWLGVPMLIGDRLIGIIALDRQEPSFYTAQHARLAEAFAAQAAIAVENARLHRQLIDYADHLEQRVGAKVRELDKARAKVVHAGKMASLGEMATSVAHELTQPLTAILYEVQYLEKVAGKIEEGVMDDLPLLGEQLRKVSEKITADVDRCTRLIDHLRTFGAPLKTRVSSVDVNEAIENSFVLLGRRLDQHNVEVRRLLSPDLPLVLADLHRLEQVFINLIGNAEHAVEEMARRVETGEVERSDYQKLIEISTFLRGDLVVTVVRDNGCGMSEDEQSHVFEPFFTTKPMGKGTGLGLSISSDIVRSFGGTISFESVENEGTTFYVRLPVPRG